MVFNGTFLREKRKLKGWTIRDLANKLGIDFSQISRWENGSEPYPSHIKRLSKIFGVKPEAFFKADNSERSGNATESNRETKATSR